MKQVKILKQPKIISPIDEPGEQFLKGKEEGYTKAMKEGHTFITLLQSITMRLLEQKERLLHCLKPELIDFAITVCEKVIRQELSSPQTMFKLINSHLASVTPRFHAEMITIALSPDDLVMLDTYLSKLSYDKKEIKRIRFIHDKSLSRGDFRIETQTGLLNCTIEREIFDIKQKVLLG
ncbi:MAG: hypothetical protein KDK55_03310 [Chlamydiia bacterium]|nr:hypothetical protein [Chlamydiia bacterium]